MCTSKKVENEGKGKAPFVINIRSVTALREIGRGYSSLEKFCGFLNFLSPMQVGAFNETQKNIVKAYNVVATESMIAAVIVIRTHSLETRVVLIEIFMLC